MAAYSLEDLARVRAALANPEAEVSIGNPPSKVRFRSVQEIREMERIIVAELEAAASGGRKKFRRLVAHGWGRGL
jgi:hypothetical protein